MAIVYGVFTRHLKLSKTEDKSNNFIKMKFVGIPGNVINTRISTISTFSSDLAQKWVTDTYSKKYNLICEVDFFFLF